jgi:hypothetical protein
MEEEWRRSGGVEEASLTSRGKGCAAIIPPLLQVQVFPDTGNMSISSGGSGRGPRSTRELGPAKVRVRLRVQVQITGMEDK